MKNKLIFLYIAVMAILVIAGAITWSKRGDSRPTKQDYLDKFDIKTDNPQPAGRNLPAVSP